MSKFNEDELHAPSWMNKEFFQEVLTKCEKSETVLVTDVKILPASIQGDHYASVMFRGVVTYDSDKAKGISKSLIIKTMPELEGNKKDLLSQSRVFETEISMYDKTIPKFEAELRKIGDKTVVGAQALYYSLEPRKIIIFEDICAKGYEVIRGRDATIEEAKEGYLKLAKWHAVSYKLAAEGDTSVTDYQEGIFSHEKVEESEFITSGIGNFIDSIEKMDEFKSYAPKFRSVQKDLIKRCVSSFQSFTKKSPFDINVLCHGDFHLKNMMFKHNSKGEHEDVLLIDFQLCYFGPAVLDVLYGMYMLNSPEIRQNHYDEIIHFYSSAFIETLEKLKFRGHIPKISDFFIDILHHRHFEIFMFTTFLPFWYAMSESSGSFDNLIFSNDERLKNYWHPGYVKEIRRLLPLLLHKGYIE